MDKLFLEDFGQTPCKLFKEFDSEPIAAASLAQVHKAVAKDGTKLAVKVRLLIWRFKLYIALYKQLDVISCSSYLTSNSLLHSSCILKLCLCTEARQPLSVQ